MRKGLDGDFYQYLVSVFGYNEPISIEQIDCGDYSRPWLFKKIKELVEIGKLIRFDVGIYYLPTKTAFGFSLLNPRKVIELKYLSSGNDVYGYYSGITLRNGAGLTTQMPNVLEVVTNNESAKVREVKVGEQIIKTRKARVKITTDNVNTLQFLELMNSLENTDLDESEKTGLKRFIKRSGINMKDVLTYVPSFPAKAMKNLMLSGAINELT